MLRICWAHAKYHACKTTGTALLHCCSTEQHFPLSLSMFLRRGNSYNRKKKIPLHIYIPPQSKTMFMIMQATIQANIIQDLTYISLLLYYYEWFPCWFSSPSSWWHISGPSYSGHPVRWGKHTSMNRQISLSRVRDPAGADRLWPLQSLHSSRPVGGQRSTGGRCCCCGK